MVVTSWIVASFCAVNLAIIYSDITVVERGKYMEALMSTL